MLRTSEWVSLGHPDKIADYISCYLLDRHLERDPKTRFAVEVMVKDQIVTLGGEIASEADFSDDELTAFVRQAVNEIGYTRMYQEKWGRENTICGDQMEVYPLLGRQSPDIGQGVDRDAWGDQGIFFGMALDRPSSGNMPRDHYLARKLGQALFKSRLGGLDIKTLVATEDGNATHVTVAIPLLDGDWNEAHHRQRHGEVREALQPRRLRRDGAQAGRGPLRRKLPHRRRLALDQGREQGRPHPEHPRAETGAGLHEGEPSARRPHRRILLHRLHGHELKTERTEARPSELIRKYGLDKPVFTRLCREGLFHAVR